MIPFRSVFVAMFVVAGIKKDKILKNLHKDGLEINAYGYQKDIFV